MSEGRYQLAVHIPLPTPATVLFLSFSTSLSLRLALMTARQRRNKCSERLSLCVGCAACLPVTGVSVCDFYEYMDPAEASGGFVFIKAL